jgi:hypothetical protein
LGIGSPAGFVDGRFPGAGLDVTGGPFDVRFGPINTREASFGFRMACTPNSGDSRPNCIHTFGFNPENKAGIHGISWNVESWFSDGITAQQEYYFVIGGTRVQSMFYRPVTDAMLMLWQIDQMTWMSRAGLDYMNFSATDGIIFTEQISPPRTAHITFQNSAEWAIVNSTGEALSGPAFKGVTTNTAGVATGIGASSAETNFSANYDPVDNDLYLTLGGRHSAPGYDSSNNSWTGFRWNHTAQRPEYATSYGTTAAPPTFRAFNDELKAIEHHYQVTRTLGNSVGDWTEIGTLDVLNSGTGAGIFELLVHDGEGATGKNYQIPTHYSLINSGLGWTELVPLTSTARGGLDDYAIDFQSETQKLRLRRLTGGAAGPGAITVLLKEYGDSFERFTPSSTTGSSGTVSGIYGGTRFGQKNGVLSIYDGTIMQPIDVAGANSCGDGYRCLRIPN